MMQRFKQFLLFISISCCFTSVHAVPQSLDKIVAVVNDVPITQSAFNKQMQIATQQLQASGMKLPANTTLREYVLQQMIDTELQLEMAKKIGLKVDDKMLDKAIDDIAQRNGLNAAVLQTKLEQQGMKFANYREEIRQQILLSQLQEKMVAPKINISEQEVADALANSNNSLKQLISQQHTAATTESNIRYHIEDIYIPLPEKPTAAQTAAANQQAQAVLAQAQKGTSFAQITKSAAKDKPLLGGDLGWRTLDQIPDIFDNTVKNLNPGSIAGPIQAPNGFHILHLIAKTGSNNTMAGKNIIANNMNQYHVRHILLRTTPLLGDAQARQRLLEIRDNILRGGDFAKLAGDNSQDPGSAIKGGDLGWLTPDMVDPRFAEIMSQTKVGEISQPFKSQFGWHILQILEVKKSDNNKAFLQNQARQLVYQRKYQEALKAWLKQLRAQAYIKICRNSLEMSPVFTH